MDRVPRTESTPRGQRLLAALSRSWADGHVERAEAHARELAEEAASADELVLASRALAALGAPRDAVRAAERALTGDATGTRTVGWAFSLLVALGYTHRARDLAIGATGGDRGFTSNAARVLAWMGDAASAARLGLRALEAGPDDGRCAVATSEALEELGRRDEGAAVVLDAFGRAEGDERWRLAERLLRLGGAREVEAASLTDDGLAPLGAEIALWRGDETAFCAALARVADVERRARLEAAHALADRAFDQVARLLREADASDPVVSLLGAELALRQGRVDQAMELVVRASNGVDDSPSWVAAQALQVSMRCVRARDSRAQVGIDGLETLVRAVAELVPDHTPVRGERTDAASMQRDVDALLARLGANRTHFTYVRDATGALRPWFPGPSLRRLCIRAQRELRWRTLDEAVASFDELVARWPESFHVRAYRGEILLWSGRYEEAFAQFERPALEGRRWPPIGAGAAMLCLGRPADARRWLDLAARHAAGPGPPWYAWEGEWHLAHGSVARAREALGACLADGSRRLGALVAMALLTARHGPVDEADARWDALAKRAPLLLQAGTARAGRGASATDARAPHERAEALAAALELLRGNRSSNTPSFDDGRGVAVYEAPEEWRAALALDGPGFARLLAAPPSSANPAALPGD